MDGKFHMPGGVNQERPSLQDERLQLRYEHVLEDVEGLSYLEQAIKPVELTATPTSPEEPAAQPEIPSVMSSEPAPSERIAQLNQEIEQIHREAV